jgi:hypothetical protein
MMKIIIRTFFCSMIILSVACAGKQTAPKSFRTIQKIRVGIIELNETTLNTSGLLECSKNYPGMQVTLNGATREELSQKNWTKNRWVASLAHETFEQYDDITGYGLLLLIFRNKQEKTFVRTVNFLSKQVRTNPFEPETFECEQVYSTAKIQVIDSHPPFADVYIDDQQIGEAPVWMGLPNGTYDLQCKLPSDAFPKTTLKVPGDVFTLCKRGNQMGRGNVNNSDEDDAYEKSQGWFLYLMIGALSVGSAVLPFLLF